MRSDINTFKDEIKPLLEQNGFIVTEFNINSFRIEQGETKYDFYPIRSRVFWHGSKIWYNIGINNLVTWLNSSKTLPTNNHTLQVTEVKDGYEFKFKTEISGMSFTIDKNMYNLMANHFNKQ